MQEASPFLRKLWILCNDESLRRSGVGDWSENGQQFLVLNSSAFAEEIQQRFCWTHKSFLRQLHFYGFEKTDRRVTAKSGGSSTWSFQHQFFNKGQEALLAKIKRKTFKAKRGQASSSQQELQDELSRLRAEVAHLRKKLEEEEKAKAKEDDNQDEEGRALIAVQMGKKRRRQEDPLLRLDALRQRADDEDTLFTALFHGFGEEEKVAGVGEGMFRDACEPLAHPEILQRNMTQPTTSHDTSANMWLVTTNGNIPCGPRFYACFINSFVAALKHFARSPSAMSSHSFSAVERNLPQSYPLLKMESYLSGHSRKALLAALMAEHGMHSALERLSTIAVPSHFSALPEVAPFEYVLDGTPFHMTGEEFSYFLNKLTEAVALLQLDAFDLKVQESRCELYLAIERFLTIEAQQALLLSQVLIRKDLEGA